MDSTHEAIGGPVEGCNAESTEWRQAQQSLAAARQALAEADVVGCIAHLSMSLKHCPSQAEARLLRGRVLLAVGRADDAAADAEWLATEGPDASWMAAGESEKGIADEAECTALREETLLLLARVAGAQGKMQQAIDHYGQLLAHNPQSTVALQERAQTLMLLGRVEAARADTSALLQLDPSIMQRLNGSFGNS